MSNLSPVNLDAEIQSLGGHWQPKLISTINGSQALKVARIQGNFIWHSHPDSDEIFYCVSGGPMNLEVADAATNDEKTGGFTSHELKVGDMFMVPKGRRHRPVAEQETGILLIEKFGTVNTGDMEGKEEAKERTFYVEDNKRQ